MCLKYAQCKVGNSYLDSYAEILFKILKCGIIIIEI